jgi:hypothetical protein
VHHKKSVSKRKVCIIFIKNKKFKKPQKPKKPIFSAFFRCLFFGVFLGGFFWVGFLLPTLHIKAAGGLPVALLPEEDETARQRGVLSDRFTKESVVLTAPAKPKAGGGELQLSSMSALTNKTSSQSFFLRVLKAKKI